MGSIVSGEFSHRWWRRPPGAPQAREPATTPLPRETLESSDIERLYMVRKNINILETTESKEFLNLLGRNCYIFRLIFFLFNGKLGFDIEDHINQLKVKK